MGPLLSDYTWCLHNGLLYLCNFLRQKSCLQRRFGTLILRSKFSICSLVNYFAILSDISLEYLCGFSKSIMNFFWLRDDRRVENSTKFKWNIILPEILSCFVKKHRKVVKKLRNSFTFFLPSTVTYIRLNCSEEFVIVNRRNQSGIGISFVQSHVGHLHFLEKE